MFPVDIIRIQSVKQISTGLNLNAECEFSDIPIITGRLTSDSYGMAFIELMHIRKTCMLSFVQLYVKYPMEPKKAPPLVL